MEPGEEFIFALGSHSFNYKLHSDINNFDRILMANATIDLVINNELDMLEQSHMEILLFALSDPDFGPAS